MQAVDVVARMALAALLPSLQARAALAAWLPAAHLGTVSRDCALFYSLRWPPRSRLCEGGDRLRRLPVDSELEEGRYDQLAPGASRVACEANVHGQDRGARCCREANIHRV